MVRCSGLEAEPKFFCESDIFTYRPVSSVVKYIAIGAGRPEFNSRVGKKHTMSSTALHRCDISSELCCAGAQPRRRTSRLVTRFTQHRECSEDLIYVLSSHLVILLFLNYRCKQASEHKKQNGASKPSVPASNAAGEAPQISITMPNDDETKV